MVSMKKRTAVAVTVGVWIASLGSAAALTYDLNRTLQLVAPTSQPARPFDTAPAPLVQPVSGPAPVLYIPTVTIVGPLHRPPVVRALKAAVDISQMRCADWRELDIGSGRVQVCE